MKKRIMIGIESQDNIRARMIAIAKGEYKPKRNEPKVWFTSMKSMSEVLSDKNRELIHIIAETHPQSLAELSIESGRKASNLSRTLKTLESYGFVTLKKKNKNLVPTATATEFQIIAA
jgi:predicted transcriptional regulator